MKKIFSIFFILMIPLSSVYANRPESTNSLIYASMQGNMELGRRYLSEGADVNGFYFEYGEDFPLLNATELAAHHSSHREMVKLLLDWDAYVNAITSFKLFALAIAVDHDDVETVKLLLERGADPTRKYRGCTLRELAISNNNEEISGLLEEAESFTKPPFPRERIPRDIPQDVIMGIEGLYSSEPRTRCKAANSLALMDRQAVFTIPYLVGLLGDPTDITMYAHENEDSEISGLLFSPDPCRPRFQAAAALEKIGQPALEPLIGALKHDNPLVRQTAAITLSKIKHKDAISHLAWAALKDENPLVRRSAVGALGKYSDDPDYSSIIKFLVNAFKDKDPMVRQYALSSLHIHEPDKQEFSGFLIKALEDENPKVREMAATKLGALKDIDAVEALIENLDDKDVNARIGAYFALMDITGQDFERDKEKWKEWWEKEKTKK